MAGGGKVRSNNGYVDPSYLKEPRIREDLVAPDMVGGGPIGGGKVRNVPNASRGLRAAKMPNNGELRLSTLRNIVR